MKNLCRSLLLVLICMTQISLSQSLSERYKDLGEMFLPAFSTAPFPDPERMDGHTYNNKIYSYEEHYADSTVAVFIPKGFNPGKEINLVVYVHGWFADIDTACSKFKLIEQFAASRKNAIFVFPEGPKKAPDSYGGKLERENGLTLLVNDVFSFLKEKKKISSVKPGKIILAGHSGAYRVIAYCLMRGGLTKNISDVILFDALYAETEKFTHWIENYKGRFINIFTNEGGTKGETENMMDDLEAWRIPYFKTEENNLKMNDLSDNRLIFIHTDLEHNDVLAVRNQFQNFLTTSKLEDIKK